MEQAALLVEEDDLERFKYLCQLARCDVRVDVEDLAIFGLGQASEDGQGTSADARFDWLLVDLCDLADKSIFLAVEIVGEEDAIGDRAGSGSQFFEGFDELEIFGEEDLPGDFKGLGVSDANTVDVVRDDAGVFEELPWWAR